MKLTRSVLGSRNQGSGLRVFLRQYRVRGKSRYRSQCSDSSVKGIRCLRHVSLCRYETLSHPHLFVNYAYFAEHFAGQIAPQFNFPWSSSLVFANGNSGTNNRWLGCRNVRWEICKIQLTFRGLSSPSKSLMLTLTSADSPTSHSKSLSLTNTLMDCPWASFSWASFCKDMNASVANPRN